LILSTASPRLTTMRHGKDSRVVYYLLRQHPVSTLFPYTTLFRSAVIMHCRKWSIVCAPDARRRHSVGDREANTDNGRNDGGARQDRKSTRLNSSHDQISYAVFCLKKKRQGETGRRC